MHKVVLGVARRRVADLRRYARAMAVALLAAVGLVVGEARSETWIQVEDAAWSLDSEMAARLFRDVERAFSRAAKRHDDVPTWETYTIQYQGRLENGARVVKLSGMCERAANHIAEDFELSREFIGASHGGPCFFVATYDPKSYRLLEFRFNDTYG